MKNIFVALSACLFLSNVLLAQDQPVAAISVSQTDICLFSSVAFADVSTDPNGHSIIAWNWQFGNGNSSMQQNPIVNYNSPGTYTVMLVVTNDVGGKDTAYQMINVHGVSVSASVINETCFGACNGVIQLQVVGTDAPFAYSWSNGFTVPNLVNACPGNYTVTVTNNFGCTTVNNFTILGVNAMTVDVIPGVCVDSMGYGHADINFSGGTLPYSFNVTCNSGGPWTGNLYSYLPGNYTLIVIDGNGCTVSDNFIITSNTCHYTLSGWIFNDLNGNNTKDAGEPPLPGILVYSNPGPLYAYTNDSGYYDLPLDSGVYSVIAVTPANWEVSFPVQGFHNISISNFDDTITGINFAMSPLVTCPEMIVNIGNGNVRPCFTTRYYFSYNNHGTVIANNVQIVVDLETDLTAVASSIPWSGVTGNSYTFDIGDVDVFETGSFWVDVNVTCNTSLLGHTRCVTAHIYPDSLCIPPDPAWDHSSISVTGECRGDTNICFLITNTGDFSAGDMQGTSDYRIYSNDTLVYEGTFQLQGGMSMEVCWPATGAAIRLEADQRPNHPGNSHPTETIEDCGDPAGISLGFITSAPYDDQNDFIDISCNVLTGSYDPNDKSVQPSGITSNHYIDNDVPLTYHINFQNTGTDTAFTVVIRDTLSQYLDVSSVQNGASSHPCTFRVYGAGILEWTFSNILLPDSNINEPLSHGFVNFTVNQKPLTPADYGTVISNSAAIYFDFNPPVITNNVELVYWDLPLVISHFPEQSGSNAEIVVYPNPVVTNATFEIRNYNLGSNVELIIFDNTGRVVFNTSATNTNKIIVPVEIFKKGLYFYQITDEEGIVGHGKVIVE